MCVCKEHRCKTYIGHRTMGQNSFLEKIGGKFSAVVANKKNNSQTEFAVPAPPASCSCGSLAQWLQRGTSTWRCEACQPPPSESFVASRRGQRAIDRVVLVETIEVTCCVPWCLSCGSHRGVEKTWSDGVTNTHCQVCGSELSEWPEQPVVSKDAGEVVA